MGRIDAVLADDLDDRFRMEVARRYGARKGTLLKAISEAIELWMTTDKAKSDAKRFGKIVRSPKESTGIKQHTVDLLSAMGVAGRDVLTDIAADTAVSESIREQSLKALKTQADR